MKLNTEKTKEVKNTVFEKQIWGLNGELGVGEASFNPYEFDNVVYLGKDENLGDVFKCWDSGTGGFSICFGKLGEENYESI